MNQSPRETLRKLVQQHGRSLCSDARRCEALLRDYCPESRRGIFVLTSALHEQTAEELLAADGKEPSAALLKRLADRLCDRLGLRYDLAVWAVESWALALDVVSPDELPRIDFVCPRCRHKDSIGYEHAGAAITCQRCSSQVRISPDGEHFALETDGTEGAAADPWAEDMYRRMVSVAAADGRMKVSESARLDELRRRLSLPRDAADRIRDEVLAEHGILRPIPRQTAPSVANQSATTSPRQTQWVSGLDQWMKSHHRALETAKNWGGATAGTAVLFGLVIRCTTDYSISETAVGIVAGALFGGIAFVAGFLVDEFRKGRISHADTYLRAVVWGILAGGTLGGIVGGTAIFAAVAFGIAAAFAGGMLVHVFRP